MFRNWLAGHLEERALKGSAKEVRRFVGGLQGTGDRDLGVIVGCAAVVRVNMEIHGVLPAGLFQRRALEPSEELGVMQLRINRAARQLAKIRQQADATGAMVWSYSLRCLNLPELRPLGREMWGELKRGFEHAEEALREGETRNGRPFDRRVWAEWRLIPPGLDPAD
ncbi:hypothetical protein [Shumkonia mesophila]|uniref:hypothetical protein n=1 Tax=Shumkonia mesophila TaxID=2838854 RepID=UPI0029345851|nr:hypothetical protein [Shumkonia mesophila]